MDINSISHQFAYSGLVLAEKLIPDSFYNRFWFRVKHWQAKAPKQKLNIRKPRSFSDKIIWLKLNHVIKNSSQLVDKFLVREFVSEKIGSEYLIPLIGAWDDAEAIEFDDLPDRFVAKASHGSGWNIVCEDKKKLDVKVAKRTFARWLKLNYYYYYREEQYRHCPPRIVIEKHLGDISNQPAEDYKFFCFAGEPKYVQIDVDRFTKHKQAFYDVNWNKLYFHQLFPRYNEPLEKPKKFDELLDMARKLSEGLPFARIDLYHHGGNPYFGEITLHPHSGCAPFFPFEYDLKFGNDLDLSLLANGN